MNFNFDPSELLEFFNMTSPEENAKKFYNCVIYFKDYFRATFRDTFNKDELKEKYIMFKKQQVRIDEVLKKESTESKHITDVKIQVEYMIENKLIQQQCEFLTCDFVIEDNDEFLTQQDNVLPCMQRIVMNTIENGLNFSNDKLDSLHDFFYSKTQFEVIRQFQSMKKLNFNQMNGIFKHMLLNDDKQFVKFVKADLKNLLQSILREKNFSTGNQIVSLLKLIILRIDKKNNYLFLSLLQDALGEDSLQSPMWIDCVIVYFSSQELDNLVRIESIEILNEMFECLIENSMTMKHLLDRFINTIQIYILIIKDMTSQNNKLLQQECLVLLIKMIMNHNLILHKPVLQFFQKNADNLIEIIHRNFKELKEDDELLELTTEDKIKDNILQLKDLQKNIKINEAESNHLNEKTQD